MTNPSNSHKTDTNTTNQKNDTLTQTDDAGIDCTTLINNWQQVKEQIGQTCTEATQQTESKVAEKVTLLAVSKTKPAKMIAALAERGQSAFGENYLQEAIDKIKELQADPRCAEIVWHYIGSIQRNKTRDIAEHFDWVQTVERDIIAKRLNDQRPETKPPLNVLIQLNIDDEDSKSGCLPEELPELIAIIKGYERLQLRGLMIIPAKADTDAFARTQQLFADIKQAHPELTAWDTLSMGMSGDMSEAITNGSTMIRVGTAIFGARD